jgi:hypothetical protein
MSKTLGWPNPDGLQRQHWIFAFAIVFGLGMTTLSRSPLPWYDEVFLASVSESWVSSGEFTLGINKLRTNEILVYGPVFFYIQGCLFNFFEMNIYTVRLPAFIAGIGIVCVSFSLLRKWEVPTGLAKAFCLALAMDHMFGRGMYSGRMDLVALFMVLLALRVLQFAVAKPAKVQTCLLCAVGLLAGISCLTTPRVIFWLIGLPFFAWSQHDKAPYRFAAYRTLGISACASALGICWMYKASGGIVEYWQYLASQNQLWHHVGNNSLIRHRSELPVYLSMTVGTFFFLKNWKNTETRKRVAFAGLFCVLVSFILLVKEVGPYESMILPTYIFLIALAASVMQRTQANILVTFLLCAVSLMFFGKKAVVFTEWNTRNAMPAFIATQAVHTPNSSFLADDKYFYTVRQSGADFHSWRQLTADAHFPTTGVNDRTIKTLLQETHFALIDQNKEKTVRDFIGIYGFDLEPMRNEPMRNEPMRNEPMRNESIPATSLWDFVRPVNYASSYSFRIYRLTEKNRPRSDQASPIRGMQPTQDKQLPPSLPAAPQDKSPALLH